MAELTRKEVILILAGASPNSPPSRGECQIRLAGVDLSGLDLHGLNFAHADLAGADLRGSDLSDARLFEADLSSADLGSASLRGVFADGATFIDAQMVGADFRPSQRGLFYGTHLAGADFQGADLSDARLDGAHLWDARFFDARLVRAHFGRARMNRRTVFARADLTDCRFADVDWAVEPDLSSIPACPAPHLTLYRTASSGPRSAATRDRLDGLGAPEPQHAGVRDSIPRPEAHKAA